MPPTHCLYIEDQERDRVQAITPMLKKAFREAFRFAQLDVAAVNFDEGEGVLHERGNEFDVIVIDVYDRQDDGELEIRGFPLIREAARTTDAAVIAISQVPDAGAEALDAGAHVFVQKDALRRAHGLEYLTSQIRNALQAARVRPKPETAIQLDYELDDVRLAALIDHIGEDNLVALLAQIPEATPERVKLNYIRGGLSGAIVLHWEYLDSYGKHEFLLKTSRDHGRMVAEERAWKDAHFGQLLVPAPSHKLVDAGGWYALAPKFRRGVMMTDWLCSTDAPNADAVVKALDELFGDGGLSEVARGSGVPRPEDRPSDVVAAGLLTLRRSANIIVAMSELMPLIDRHQPDATPRLELARKLLRSGAISDVDRGAVPRGSYVVRCHGDLHGRNVLVGSRENVVLLDPADSAMLHWSADWARLTIDLLLSGIASDPRAHEWDDVTQWRAAVKALVRGETLPETPALPEPARVAVDWLRAEAPSLFSGIGEGVPQEWELRLGLTAELLRGSYRREELPAPIRVSALVAALDAIEATAERVPPVRPSHG